MPRYLTFALVAPLAAFGAIAVGERRSGWDRPARSAVLGLVGACLGLDREDDAAQAALAEGYGLALLCHAPGRLLADYHTTQVPSAQRGSRFATRAEELAAPEPQHHPVAPRLSQRRVASRGALGTRRGRSLAAGRLSPRRCERPGFVPYLGRKSCPLGLPLAPCIAEAADPPTALLARRSEGPEAMLEHPKAAPARRARRRAGRDDHRARRCRHGPERPPSAAHTSCAGDQPRSRRRWQFDLREEAVLGVTRS